MKILFIISVVVLMINSGGKPDVVWGEETKMKSQSETTRVATFAADASGV